MKIISLKQKQYGFSGWSTDIFDGTAVTLWAISIGLLFFMALTFFKRAHMIEFIGVFLDQPMPRYVAQPFVALTRGMALVLTLMVKSTLISHLVKPVPWKGPDNLEELVAQTPGVKLLVKSTTTLAEIIESHPLYKSHPEKFLFRDEYPLKPLELRDFLQGRYAFLEMPEAIINLYLDPSRIECQVRKEELYVSKTTVTTGLSAFVMRKNFTHAELINKQMMYLFQQGLVSMYLHPEKHLEFRMEENYQLCNNTQKQVEPSFKSCRSEDDNKALALEHFKSTVKVYVLGLVMSSLAFVAEIMWHAPENRFARERT